MVSNIGGVMGKLLKWFGIGFIVVAFLVSVVAIGALYIFYNSISNVKGEAVLNGLSGPAQIVRDENHIPHIEAKSKVDAIRLLGIAHASDRLWQMEVMRMASQGRLSEIFGKATIETDRFLRTLDLVTPSQKSYDVLDAKTQSLLIAYAMGVNEFLQRKKHVFEANLPPEFMILGHQPEAWQPWHSIAILKVMSLTLDNNMGHEIGRLTLAMRGFSSEGIDDIYPYDPRDTPVPLPDLRQLYGWGLQGKVFEKMPTKDRFSVTSNSSIDKSFSKLAWPIHQSASNSWAVSGSKTHSGKPLLANDLHLGFTAPSTMYLAHINFEKNGKQRNVIGGTIAGMPIFFVGRNDTVAWGLTTTKLDSQDLFIEKINTAAKDEYLGEYGYQKFLEREVTLKVKGGDDVVFWRLETRNGPVLPMTYKKLGARLPKGTVAALGWVALANDDTSIAAAIRISDATSVNDVMRYSRKLVSPMQNIIAADVDGNIGLIAAGRIPKRSKDNLVRGRAPVPGWVEKYRWQGFVSASDLPQIKNPRNGALVAANGNWLPKQYTNHITYDWSENHRQLRAENIILGRNAKHTASSVRAGMSDTYSRAMVAFRDFGTLSLSANVRINGLLFDKIRNWNGLMDQDAVEPLIMVSWFKHANQLLFEDDLGEGFELVEQGNVTRLLAAMGNGRSQNWCNKIRTPKFETCRDILSKALDLAVEELENKFGADWAQWKWGNAHKAVHEHRPFSKVGLLSNFFTLSQKVSGGKFTLLRSTNDISAENPYAAIQGAAYRAMYDLSNLDNSEFIISTGQSGNVMSKHYDDLSKKWAKQEYVSMTTRREDYRKNALGEWKFIPAQ